MKKIFISFLSLLMAVNLAYAGGLVHNNNQSAAWARMLVRDASTSIDAVFYNPAGLTKLSDGLHLSVSNQSIFQKRTLNFSNSVIMPDKEYEGSVNALFFPNFYAAYKTGNLVASFGFVPIGGGGSASYDDGAPSFDLLLNQAVVPAYVPLGATGLAGRNSSLEGSSVYFGFQAGLSYAINDMISFYAGGRYVMAKNKYKISITDIELSTADPNATLDYATVEALAGAAAAAGLADIVVDAEQKGGAVTPIIGVNLALMEDALNVGIKYEFKTSMEVENETASDNIGAFPDGEKENADIPAMLSVGVGYKFSDQFSAQIGFHNYFDKNTEWGETEGLIDNNYWELALGFEYNISEQLLLSAGFLRAQTGVNKLAYNDDLSYSLSSNTFGLGGAYKINEMLTLQFGGYYTAYTPETLDYTVYTQKYEKTNMAIAIGLDFTFGGTGE
jgi:long-chain fatty acid transport protein